VYKLHGVLVHSGDLHGGHYFALIKPDQKERWLKFDDDRVTPVTDKEVLEENYGGEALNGVPPAQPRTQVRAAKRFTNAYMLVYIREAQMDEVLPPFKEEDTPAHLSACRIGCSGRDCRCFESQSDVWTRNASSSRRKGGKEKNSIYFLRPRCVANCAR
jgi:hypothetical protein